MGPTAVAPFLQGLDAQAPPPSLTEEAYACVFYLSNRSLEFDRDARDAADRRCAAARYLRRVAITPARRVLARSCRRAGLVAHARPHASGRGRLQSRTRGEPDRGRATARGRD